MSPVTESQNPYALHALERHEQSGPFVHVDGTAMQKGAGGTQGLGWHPGPANPGHEVTSVVSAGQVPPSGRGLHAAMVPPQHGTMQTALLAQLGPPQAGPASEPPPSDRGTCPADASSIAHE